MSDQTTSQPRLPHRWWVLVVLALSVSLIVIDGTIVNVALPTIITDLKLDFAGAQWVGTLYSLIFAALLLTSGRLGDRYGRRTLLLVGVVVFTGGSILAAAAPSGGLFLAARALQGIGAAAVLPSTLSTVNATFFGRDRIIAFAVWGSTISAMAAVGPLLGGWLTTDVDWRWVFWINVPLGLLIIIGSLLVVPNTRGEHVAGFDAAGFLLSVLGFGGTVFALVQGATYGWLTPKRDFVLLGLTWPATAAVSVSLVSLIVGLLALVGFVVVETRRAKAGRSVLLDLGLFRFGSFRWGNIAATMIALGEFGLLFVLPLYLQNVLGLSPLGSGWVLAAMAIGAFVAGGAASQLSRAFTPARTAQIGLALEIIGVAGLALIIRPTSPTWPIVVWLVIYGFGLGLCSAQLTSVVLRDVPKGLSGQASATQSTVRQLGSALGVAVMSSVLGQVLSGRATGALTPTGLPAGQRQQLEQGLVDSVGGILTALREGRLPLPGSVATQVRDILADVFTNATSITMLTGVAALVLGFAATLLLPHAPAEDSSTETPAAEPEPRHATVAAAADADTGPGVGPRHAETDILKQ